LVHFIADLAALIDHLDLKGVSLVAQSMGGRAALAYAVQRPDRVSALVMASTWGSFDWPEQWQKSKSIGARPSGAFEAGPIKGLSAAFQREKPELTYLNMQIAGANRAPQPALGGAQPGGPTLEAVRALKVPLLCIAGEEDDIFPTPLVQDFAGVVPGAECHTVRGAGHSVYWEQPARFNELVLEFLSRHTGGVTLGTGVISQSG